MFHGSSSALATLKTARPGGWLCAPALQRADANAANKEGLCPLDPACRLVAKGQLYKLEVPSETVTVHALLVSYGAKNSDAFLQVTRFAGVAGRVEELDAGYVQGSSRAICPPPSGPRRRRRHRAPLLLQSFKSRTSQRSLNRLLSSKSFASMRGGRPRVTEGASFSQGRSDESSQRNPSQLASVSEDAG